MLSYIGRRVLQMVPLLLVLSVLIFVIIELPPGDFLTMRIIQLQQSGTDVAEDEIARLTAQYGLDKPLHQRYFRWIWNILRHGNFGRSFQWEKPVSEVIGERLALTVTIALLTMVFTFLVAIPIGIYSATHQYTIPDYFFTFVGFIGLSVPNFLLALLLMYFAFTQLGVSVTGLFSPEYVDAPWSWGKIANMMQRIWVPIVIVGMAGTASLIRIMRGCLLDELRKQYVVTARAKGISEQRVLFKYPVRVAINPIISTIGWLLPRVISATPLVAIVLNLPTTGPMLLRALLYQDMYLAGSFVLILSVLTVIGTLISDILLAYLDPRIRYGGVSK
jgi:peptide/nickel transport system permease protein